MQSPGKSSVPAPAVVRGAEGRLTPVAHRRPWADEAVPRPVFVDVNAKILLTKGTDSYQYSAHPWVWPNYRRNRDEEAVDCSRSDVRSGRERNGVRAVSVRLGYHEGRRQEGRLQ